MSNKIKIGHARHSEGVTKEDGTIDWRDGYSGDQYNDDPRRAEVLIEEYTISSAYDTILRPKNTLLALKSAKACEDACNNPNIGYSQFGTYSKNRNSLYTEASKVDFDLSAITTKCNTDCSAFMTLCAIAGGATFGYGLDNGSNAPTCSHMKRWFTRKNEYQVFTKSANPTYFGSTDYLKRGDILIKDGHTIMILDYGEKIPQTEREVDLSDFSAVLVDVFISDVEATKATVEAKVTKVENNSETSLSSDALNQYNWAYELISLTNSNQNPVSKTISNIANSFSLDDLEPNSSYLIKIKAEEKSGSISLSSPNILLTTSAIQSYSAEPAIEFVDAYSNYPSCSLFLNIANEFKHTILYNR